MSIEHGSQLGEKSYLMDLPPDIHRVIIEHLRMNESAIIPRYGEEEGAEELQRKRQEFYGDTTANDVARAEGLRSWSRTCHYFYSLISPILFGTVVLKTTAQSVESVKALSQTKYWSGVRRFGFVTSCILSEDGDDDDDAEEWEGDTEEEIEKYIYETKRQKIEAEMIPLAKLLSNLPPNLISLTLDFPQVWGHEYGYETLQDNHLFDDENNERLLRSEQVDRYRAFLRTAFEAVAANDISQKPDFELRLHNIPSLRCSALETGRLTPWLKHVTSFTFGACHYDNGAGWNMNTMQATYFFGEGLQPWFFDHLDNVRTLNFHADDTWPFGHPEWYTINLPLPTASFKMSRIERLSFKQVFLCPELVRFLTSHASTIKSVEMTDCYAATDGLDEDGSQLDEDVPTWASLFAALVEAKPERLVSFLISNSDELVQQILNGGEGERVGDVANVREVLRNEAETALRAQENGAHTLDAERRRRKLLPYCTLDEKYGEIFEGQEESVLRFNNKVDHESWLKLVDIIEDNIGRPHDINRIE